MLGKTTIGAAMMFGLAGTAPGGTFLDTDGNRTAWENALGTAPAALVGSTTTELQFGTTTGTVSSLDGGGFYLGDAGPLGDNWFDAGNLDRPGDDTTVLAFGNAQSASNSNQLVIDFEPGVIAFGFDFDDIGDVGSELDVKWGDGTTQSFDLGGPGVLADGFFGLIAEPGNTIDQIFLTQLPDNNDGFTLHGFATVAIPLPAPALAVSAGLAGIVGRRPRRG